MYALNLNKENRILSATYDKYAPVHQPRVTELPQGDITDYKYINQEFIYDPLPMEENEIENEEANAANTPSQLDRIEAQVAYTAMMTDTLLEG